MSLDVYLDAVVDSDEDPCPDCGSKRRRERVYHENITHNLVRMAKEAGIYEALWRPEEIGIKKASQLIEPLRAGLALLRDDPARFVVHDPPNRWGSYEGLVRFVGSYLESCLKYQDADVSVWR